MGKPKSEYSRGQAPSCKRAQKRNGAWRLLHAMKAQSCILANDRDDVLLLKEKAFFESIRRQIVEFLDTNNNAVNWELKKDTIAHKLRRKEQAEEF